MRESVSDITAFFDYKETIITLNAIGSLPLFDANALRAGFIVSNLTAGQNAYISLQRSNRGIFVAPTAAPVFMLVQDIGAATRQQWFGTRTGGTPVDLHVFEIFYNPDAGRQGNVPPPAFAPSYSA